MLLLDVGNSRLKWARAQRGVLQQVTAVEHAGRPGEWLAAQRLPLDGPIWVAHVLGAEHEAAMAQALEAQGAVKPRFARTQAERDGLRSGYAEPERLGVDRWLAMLALWTRTREPFCVVSAGTALTFDAVDARGLHLGGLIAPGLTTAQQAIRASTRFAMRAHEDTYGAGLGNDTESCVRQGALHACVGLAERAARGAQGARYLTGGDAQILLPHLGAGWELRKDLVLEGLIAYAGTEH